MDEKVERAAESNSVSRQVGSRPQPVTNEAFLPSGHGIAYEPTFISSNLRPLIFGKLNGGMRVTNYSVQTGEEFALQFAQEASRTQRRVELEQVPLSNVNAHESNTYVYEDLTGILGIGRVDSGTNSEISILGAERGNLSGYGSHFKSSYNDSLQGIQTSRSGNDGGYHLEEGSFASTQQTGLHHTSYSMHQSYHSGLSTDSSQGKVKFMCSFGGKVLPRPSDGKLRYVGGETRIITVNKDVGYEELMQKIIDVYGQALILKYQLPGEDLDALVSVSSDEDLENMMEEYYKLDNKDGSSRLRIFLFTGLDNELTHFDVIADMRHSKQQYVDAVNGILETSTRKHSGSIVSFSSQHLDNLIGLDVAENWNTAGRAQEDMDSLRLQYSKDGQKIVNFPNVVPLSSKPSVSNSAFAIKSPTISAPFSSLPMHVRVIQSVVAESPMHFIQEQINLHPRSVVLPSEGIHDIDYGRPISSSAAFHPDFQNKHTESKTSQDSAGNQNNDFLLPSHSDSMYKGDGQFTDTKVAQPTLDLRSDELHSVDLQRITHFPPPVHQPVWHRFDTEQYSYTPTDYVPQVNSGSVHLQHRVQQYTVQNTQSGNLGTAVPKQTDSLHLTHDDEVEAPQGSSLSNDTGSNTVKQATSSPHQGGVVQSIAEGEQTHNTPHVDQQYISTRVLEDDNQQGFPSNLSHSDEQFTHQQTISEEVVTNLNERFIRPQALPHVLSDNVLQTHATKSVHLMSEGASIYQGHHSDSLIGTGPFHAGPRTTQESLISFLDQGGVADADSKVVHQDERISPVFSGWQQGKATHGSGESLKEQNLFHSNFSEILDESDKTFDQKSLEKSDKMPAARRTRTDQFDCSNEEQISELSGVDYAKPAASYGVLKPPEDMTTLVSLGLGTSYEAFKKTDTPETLVPASYQLKVPITAGQIGATYIVTEAAQASQLSERMNHSVLPRPGSSVQEGIIFNPLEEHTAYHHAGNVHLQLPTFDQRISNERLTETGSNPFLPTTGVEACVPSSMSGVWWDDMRSERDYTNVEASRYTCEPKGNLIDELAHDQLPSTVNNDTSRSQYHPVQFLGQSLIDDDYGHLYPVSGILSNARFIDDLPSSSSLHVPVSSEDGIYQKTVPLDHNISKGLFHQPAADQAGSDEIDESYSNDFKSHLDIVGVALDHVNLHENLDMERNGESLNFSQMMETLNSNFPPTSTLSDGKWGAASEDVRVDDNILLEKVVEVADEDSTIIEGSILNHDSDNDEARNEDSDKDEAASDAVIAECEAIAHGLQIIKNADLEELRELGSGTFGTVYHGKWRGSDVAIKRIKNSCFMGRPSEQERMRADFWREALMLAQMHHPNVVAFYGVVPDGPGGTLATVTEYMVNGSLKQVLQRKDRSIDRRKRLLIAMDAAFGMEYLHSKNIVHFDLKCENLLVNMRDPQRPICKVGDLGLSKIKHQTLVSGGVRGTLPWMAPELLNGSSNMVSEKVDVFSFGIVMWELLTGEEPYANMHYGAIIGGIVSNTLRPHVPNWCDPAWRSLMEQCWSADPNGRPSFTEIANRLRAMAISFHSRGHGHHHHVHHG
ncbi:hypothetical protein SUGI_1111770 [Cryptomeria japonica]|uniref:uncharacterized protein LOC131075206 n=1 Tax=Cryptomeria japonica TaxID=3369 RepID=UPI0024146DE6|nr:uncharacterized protein LOC131075206 [Cryptomeria japonica]XP_057868016.2 uncharacterized protein LOC131075206 [Cryptomeria japonica]GLJ52258.1 hypothetical protein SUGI_1111770 [Cryptomeria japonica]